ncbi:MAG: alpha/beta hydrolase [Balneolales bacterium]|nr:alpha/beta hydrolase [Balneolales bacterium]
MPEVLYEVFSDFSTEILHYPHRNLKGKASSAVFLCFHGFGGNARTFRRLAPFLTNHADTYSFSLPWHGKTSIATPGVKSLNIDLYVEDLYHFVKKVAPDGAFMLAHSFGGRIAALFAARYPELTKGLFLIAPGGYYPPEDLMFRFLGSSFVRPFTKKDWFIRLFARFLIPNLTPEKESKTVIALRHIGWSFPSISLKATRKTDILKKYPGFMVLILGNKDRLLPASYAPKIAAYYRNPEIQIIDGAGHLPMATHPESVYEIILSKTEAKR